MNLEKQVDNYLLQIWPIKGWTAEEIKYVCKQLDLTFVEVLSVLDKNRAENTKKAVHK